VTIFGYFLSCEEFTLKELVRQAVRAEAATTSTRGPTCRAKSPFVWPVIGALSQACSLPVTIAVTCPIMRIHLVVIAQAAATSAVQHGGRFVLGPAHFEQASSLVTQSMVEQAVPCGPEAKPIIDRIKQFTDVGHDEVYIQQIGPDQDKFFDFWESEIAPELAA
jgi:hypothetical protein